jgi:hypothetical protein
MAEPRVLAVLPVRDYADVIADTLATASRWVDRIFVLDNGSSDGTIDIVQQVARELDNVEFLGVDERPWSYSFYALIYNKAKRFARPGDWWYRLDADEFLVADPHETLARVAEPYDTVWGSFFNYYFTPSDLAAYEADPERWLRIPLFERVRWYRNDWAEPRFVRHRRLMRWVDGGWREGAHCVAPVLVPVRQYRYRSPAQIEHRLALRSSKDEWEYERPEFQLQYTRPLFPAPAPDAPAWHRMIADPETLDFDDGRQPLRHRAEYLPPIPPMHGATVRVLDRAAALTDLYPHVLRVRQKLSRSRSVAT